MSRVSNIYLYASRPTNPIVRDGINIVRTVARNIAIINGTAHLAIFINGTPLIWFETKRFMP